MDALFPLMFRFFRTGTALLLLVGFLLCGSTEADSPWTRRAGLRSSAVPLREFLHQLGSAQGIDIFLDRRIDPSIPLEWNAVNEPLDQLLEKIAESLNLGCCFFDRVVYIGPKNSAGILPRLIQSKRKSLTGLSGRARSVLQRTGPLEIEMLDQPQAILLRLAKEQGFRIVNPELIPHDLWYENRLEELSNLEQLSLLLIGWDLDYRIENASPPIIKIVPIDPNTRPAESNKIVKKEARKPSAQKKEPRTEEKTAQPVPMNRRRFTMRVEHQRLDAVLEMLAERLQLTLDPELERWPQFDIQPDTRVSFNVENATVQELFQAVFESTKWDFRIKNNSIQILKK